MDTNESAPHEVIEVEQIIKDFAAVCNKHGLDDLANTPDFILGDMILSHLACHADTMKQTMKWHEWPSLEERIKQKNGEK